MSRGHGPSWHNSNGLLGSLSSHEAHEDSAETFFFLSFWLDCRSSSRRTVLSFITVSEELER